ncbi:hypothetical protein FCH28_09825 [Streptomyces piniterrae]|uniref:Uncharacterized protein n=1 Tax=Streptomyces piniterrae TaxID=2571125 RepID=A0A4U0NMM5_9ACTN|nr:hypothetical protein [Streptomyces piniterrae]TJZ55627.1 hypothetical protein FCH28_09825 [Streptomyces piniterrae]
MSKSASELLTDEQFEAVRTTIADNNPEMHGLVAAAVLNEALAFVAACALFPEVRLVPSRTVDEGWHALILHTEIYAALCSRLGAVVHHRPESPDPSRHDAALIARTTSLIEEAGYSINPNMWRRPDDDRVRVAANCQHSDDRGPIVPIPKPKGFA